jgi:hypothetical protein
MSKDLRKGDKVSWAWGAHRAEGTIAQRFTARVRRTIKGKVVIRNASAAEPAYLIVQDDGARALKSASELTRA